MRKIAGIAAIAMSGFVAGCQTTGPEPAPPPTVATQTYFSPGAPTTAFVRPGASRATIQSDFHACLKASKREPKTDPRDYIKACMTTRGYVLGPTKYCADRNDLTTPDCVVPAH